MNIAINTLKELLQGAEEVHKYALERKCYTESTKIFNEIKDLRIAIRVLEHIDTKLINNKKKLKL